MPSLRLGMVMDYLSFMDWIERIDLVVVKVGRSAETARVERVGAAPVTVSVSR